MKSGFIIAVLFGLAVMSLPACSRTFEITGSTDPATNALLKKDLARGGQTIKAFFGTGFTHPVKVVVVDSRAGFTAAMLPQWGMTKTECWMVALGVADRLVILAPSQWKTQACEHDGGNARQVQGIITHELVHVYHGRHNPHGDFTGEDDIGWFIEGLAVYVSGQLGQHRLATARDAIAAGKAPVALASAWSGKYRYGVSGSLVEYIDRTWGRKTLLSLLPDVSQKEILGQLHVTEAGLLSGWKAAVLAGKVD